MTCDLVQRQVSDALTDGTALAPEEPAARHLATCPDCARFERRATELRGRLRVGPFEPPPPLVTDAVARLRRPDLAPPAHRRGWLPQPEVGLGRVAAVFVMAFAVGVAAVGLAGPRVAEATDVRALVLAGQRHINGLTADVEVTAHGGHPDVPVRQLRGALGYRAPETLRLDLRDVTDYPSPAWPARDVTVVVDEERSWTVARPACPSAAMPECLAGDPVTRGRTGREPFDPADPVPLDLVVPVGSFTTSARTPDLGHAVIDGRAAVGVATTAAQLDGLLGVLTGVGGVRDVHPADPVELWLDDELGVPLEARVRAGDGLERRRWALARGYEDDPPGTVILSWRLRGVDAAAPRPRGWPGEPPTGEVPAGDALRPGPFVAGEATDDAPWPRPGWLPEGMAPHRHGRAGDVAVASWSDGRAWLKVRATTAWGGGQLFGSDGAIVRRVELGEAGIGYLVEGGARLLVHADEVDVEVSGSLPTDDLLAVARNLGVVGAPVPADWSDAATGSLADAAQVLPALLAPAGLTGFDGPGVRVSRDVVVASWAGDGARAFVLTQRPGEVLGPPLDDVVIGVRVRGTTGRYTPARGELQWTERGLAVSLRSTTLGLEELRSVAGTLEPVR